ncbi:hypothetical protein BDF22DRAFT_741041 [Syncephalis plumigaleata]|nr:hypothetical protein BDF22DRAFT_741041 [Syncephalis plumigaleata]
MLFHIKRATHIGTLSAAILLLLCGSLMESAEAQFDGCSKVVQRREIRTLSHQERRTYFDAIKLLQSGPSPTLYDNYTIRHFRPANFTHGFPQFLPWHRAYILEFENDLRKIDDSIALAYWDWSYDSQAPELSPIWRPDWFGGNGRETDNCVIDGSFVGWSPFYPEPHCLRRRWDNNDTISAYYSPEMLQAIKNNAMEFDEFRRQFEAPPHNQVHISIGGEMPTLYSPNDPVFWGHHSFIDKVWSDWQDMSPQNVMSYGGINADATPALLSDQLAQLDYRVEDMMDRQRLCYEYVPAPWESSVVNPDRHARRVGNRRPRQRRATPDRANDTGYVVTRADNPNDNPLLSAVDRSELLQLRAPSRVPDAVILRNHMKVEDVRRSEEIHRKMVYELNNLSDYVSPAALINRPEFMEKLTGRVDKFTATDDKKQLHIQLPRTTPLSQDEISRMIQQIYDSSPSGPQSSSSNTVQKSDDIDDVPNVANNHSNDLNNIIGKDSWKRIWSSINTNQA